jgi:hypothetical protein
MRLSVKDWRSSLPVDEMEATLAPWTSEHAQFASPWQTIAEWMASKSFGHAATPASTPKPLSVITYLHDDASYARSRDFPFEALVALERQLTGIPRPFVPDVPDALHPSQAYDFLSNRLPAEGRPCTWLWP